jgi:hypothetical protein
MNEHDRRSELEPNQQTLREAWKTLAETLVLRGEQIDPLIGEFPAEDGGQQPYAFTQSLDRKFVTKELLDDTLLSVTEGSASYVMPHRIEVDDNEIFETVNLRWTARIKGTDISINHAIVVHRLSNGDAEHYKGFTYEEYVKISPNGKERRVSKAGYEYSEVEEEVTDEDEDNALQDFIENKRKITFDDIEKVHRTVDLLK